MAINFGAISTVGTTSSVTSVAVSGSNTLGIVFVAGDTSADNISAVSWNSVSMTKIGAVQVPGGDRWISAWWVANPASSSTIAFTGGSFWRSASFYYTGAKQTAQPDSFNTGTVASTAAISVATTVVASNCWYVMCGKNSTGGGAYTSSGVLGIERLEGDAGGLFIADSNTTVGTGSQSGTMTIGAGTPNQGAIAFSIAPAVAAGPTNLKSLSGNVAANIKSFDGNVIANIKSIDGNS